ncbi:MAG: S-adenosylmethionine:tRNA ribosyltransferase-isomerase, partial [Bacteroidales bacterium]
PLAQREKSKLLLYNKGVIGETGFAQLPDLLPKDSLLVFNNTKVIPARLYFQKNTGATIEILCLSPHMPTDYADSLAAIQKCTWRCMVGNLKRWKDELLKQDFSINNTSCSLYAKKVHVDENEVIIQFTWTPNELHFAQIIAKVGVLPLPPYLQRDTERLDSERYQTVYAQYQGSVAAPTAGLHFTQGVLNNLTFNHVKTTELTLHVGAGTFKPVKSEKICEHEMHSETFSVSYTSLLELLKSDGNVIAVGTTSARTIESIYWIGVKLLSCSVLSDCVLQWEPYYTRSEISAKEALIAVIEYLERNNLSHLTASTQILIAYPYKFKIVRGLVTNFHQPKSTLLLLVEAFLGNDWRRVYDYALANDFRFLSYGDSSLLLP